MLRKQVGSKPSREPASFDGEISIADVATVQVTSEEADHPIDNALDHNRGPGGSRWIADGPGEQRGTEPRHRVPIGRGKARGRAPTSRSAREM